MNTYNDYTFICELKDVCNLFCQCVHIIPAFKTIIFQVGRSLSYGLESNKPN